MADGLGIGLSISVVDVLSKFLAGVIVTFAEVQQCACRLAICLRHRAWHLLADVYKPQACFNAVNESIVQVKHIYSVQIQECWLAGRKPSP